MWGQLYRADEFALFPICVDKNPAGCIIRGAINCEKAIIDEWHVVEDKNAERQYFAKTFEGGIKGIQQYYAGELGNEAGDAPFVVYTKNGIEEYIDTPIYMIIKFRDPKTGIVYLTQARDFGLNFELWDDDEIEVVERVHYSENTLDRALDDWSKKLGLPIMG